MKVSVIRTVIDAHGTNPKIFVRGQEKFKIGRRAETLKTTALLRSARKLKDHHGQTTKPRDSQQKKKKKKKKTC